MNHVKCQGLTLETTVYFRQDRAILSEKRWIKGDTLKQRRLFNQKKVAYTSTRCARSSKRPAHQLTNFI